METNNLRGRDYLAETDFTREDIETILMVAEELKNDRANGILHDHVLRSKTLFMLFYNQSLRTRNSFEVGMTQLGGHAHGSLNPKSPINSTSAAVLLERLFGY